MTRRSLRHRTVRRSQVFEILLKISKTRLRRTVCPKSVERRKVFKNLATAHENLQKWQKSRFSRLLSFFKIKKSTIRSTVLVNSCYIPELQVKIFTIFRKIFNFAKKWAPAMCWSGFFQKACVSLAKSEIFCQNDH